MTLTLPKLLAFFAIFLFGIIGLMAIFKDKAPETVTVPSAPALTPIEVALDHEVRTVIPTTPTTPTPPAPKLAPQQPTVQVPEADRVNELFQTSEPKLPIVETITYKSHVAWQKGRPAWLSDYANHYQTSRHFIARSLNGKPDYLSQEIKEGDRFNVLKKDKPFKFYLVVDTSRSKMWLYYIDLDKKEKVLIKTYTVGLGRIDSSKTSGMLTPFGKYTLGDRIATYKPKVMGTYQGKKTEMVTVFGTRWIPFDKEIGVCTAPAKGFGIHGTPWKAKVNGELADSKSGIGKYESDGCIRLSTQDIEELYAIIVTKPTTIEIVPDFFKATFE